jgi:cytosine deaminase
MLTREDVIDRAEQTLRWYAANGTLHVRSHVDVTDPSLVALDALLEVRDRVRDVVTLQLVAFPQEGICSFPNGEELLAEAARRGVDVIGAIPHFEDTREDGVRSVELAVDLSRPARPARGRPLRRDRRRAVTVRRGARHAGGPVGTARTG